MSNWLYRLGMFSATKRRWVLAVWILFAVVVVVANRTAGGGTTDDFEVPGVESQAAMDVLAQGFPERAGATAMVVFHDPDGIGTDAATTSGIEATIDEVRSLDGVMGVTDPLGNPMSMSPDGTTAFAAVQYDEAVADLGSGSLEELTGTAAPAEAAGVQVEYGGELPTVLVERHTGPAEMIGVVAALIVLFVLFRSVYAMALPLGVAAVGLLSGLSIVGLLGLLIDIPSVAPRLATMIGLGVGIDYALFVASRHRDNLEAGMERHESIARTNATAGQAVVVAGGTVVVAILGLQMAGIPYVAALGYSASLVVAIAVVVAVTLLPALLGFAGDRVLPRSHRGARAHSGAGDGTGEPAVAPAGTGRAAGAVEGAGRRVSGWVRWAHWVAFHPWRSLTAATLLLAFLAIPVLDMRLGQADAGTYPESSTQRRAYDLLAAGFGEGFNGPLLITVDLTSTASGPDAHVTGPAVVERIAAGVRADPDVRAVSPPELNDAGEVAVITAIPMSKPQAEATSDLVHRLRDDVLVDATSDTGAEALVGGPTARFIDQSEKISSRLMWFIGTVVTLSFLLLMVVFRSILVPLKAALLNLLAIGAAYGVVVAVFQWGWGRSLIGLEEAVPIASFVPMMMFAILFGLSMDYEVFILSRIREEYHGGHTNIDSVVEGLGATAKVITAAALIMISVFVGFVTSADPVVKMMGIGLATAVALDATVVRMVLVPSTMALVGDANWWLPRWLDRILPHLDIEGEPPQGDGASSTTANEAVAVATKRS